MTDSGICIDYKLSKQMKKQKYNNTQYALYR